MIRIPTYPVLSAVLVVPALPVCAIEAPLDTAPPPPEVAQVAGDEAEQAAPPAEQHERAYLGVVATAVPDMLAAHLGLKEGEGIVLRALLPESPAAKAGLAMHDVITRISGEPVGSSEELTGKINARRPGDAVALDLIRDGKPMALDVTLEKRPQQLAGLEVQPMEQLNLDGIPDNLAERLRRMVEENLGEQLFDLNDNPLDAVPQIDDRMREMRERFDRARVGNNEHLQRALEGMQRAMEEMADVPAPPELRHGGIQINQGATFRLMDEEGSVEMKSVDGGKEITVRDPDGNVTWSGPWDTEQDKAGAPDDVRRRVERLNLENHGNGLRLRWHAPGMNPPGGP